MNITTVFVFPVFGGVHYENAARFVASYNLCPAGIDHRLVVVSNGGPPTIEMQCLMDQTGQAVEWIVDDNRAYDISAFQTAAAKVPCDMMVFFGTTAYLRGPGWLKRMAESFEHRGNNALYGSTANTGNNGAGVFPHIRTTGFWMAPTLMNMWPFKVTRPEQRYAAEHGPNCLTEWFRKQGLPVYMVTWGGEFQFPNWNVAEGFHNGTQSQVIVGDRLCCPPYYPYP